MRDGRSVTQASNEAGVAIYVSYATIQRWARDLDRPLSRYIHESAKARTATATAALRVYTGADYRAMASRLMRAAELGMDQLEEATAAKAGKLPEGGTQEVARLFLIHGRAMQGEKSLIELGFGLESSGAVDEGEEGELTENMLSLEEQIEQAREVARRMEEGGAVRARDAARRMAAEQDDGGR